MRYLSKDKHYTKQSMYVGIPLHGSAKKVRCSIGSAKYVRIYVRIIYVVLGHVRTLQICSYERIHDIWHHVWIGIWLTPMNVITSLELQYRKVN